MKKVSLLLLPLILFLFSSCDKGEDNRAPMTPSKNIAIIEQQWVTFIKDGGFKEEPQHISNTALSLFLEANKHTLNTTQIAQLRTIGSCDIVDENAQCHILISQFITDNKKLRDDAIRDADNTFSALSGMAVSEKKSALTKACKSDVRGLLRGIPSQYWPSSRFVLLCILYPVSGGKEKSSALEKELLRVYLTGVIDNRWNSGKLMKPMKL